MKYNTDRHKLIMIQSEVKEELDRVIIKLTQDKINKGYLKIKVSYNEAIKYLTEINKK